MQFNEQIDIQWVELPAEMLLRVLCFVPIRDLLRGPALVCRSWREAALDPAVWRHRSYSYTMDESRMSYPILKAVLRVAPCLRTLEVSFNPHEMELLSNTSCAVEDLVYSSTESEDILPDLHVDSWEPIVLRQVALGRLKSLSLHLERASAVKLMHAIGCAALTQLELKLSRLNVGHLAESGPFTGKASLKRLTFTYMIDWSGPSMMLLEHLLERNTGTLEVVEIKEEICSPRALKLIGKCYADVSSTLECCVNLRSLHIYLWNEPSLLLPYFQQATELAELRISVRSGASWIVAVLQALSSSGRSALQELWLDCVGRPCFMNEIPATLAGLPSLRRLRLFGFGMIPSRHFLDAINPIILPNLRLFELSSIAMFCLPALCSMLLRNPELRVVDTSQEGLCVRSTTCTSCQKGLHFERRRELRNACSSENMLPKKKSDLNFAWVSAASVSYTALD